MKKKKKISTLSNIQANDKIIKGAIKYDEI